MPVRYLSESALLAIHQDVIGRMGGMSGVRDRAALESCVTQPMTAVFGEERFETVCAKAAAYCYFVIRLHPFFDGNKRAGLAAAVTFLLDHGLVPMFDSDAMYNVIVRVATGDCEPEELALVFEQACRSDRTPQTGV